jgi:hypothetical protein
VECRMRQACDHGRPASSRATRGNPRRIRL